MVRGHRNMLEQLWYNFILIICAFIGAIININNAILLLFEFLSYQRCLLSDVFGLIAACNLPKHVAWSTYIWCCVWLFTGKYRGADKSLARPGRRQARKHVRNARDFNNMDTRAAIKFLFLQGKAPKEIHAILSETLACFLPSRAKDLSEPLYVHSYSVVT